MRIVFDTNILIAGFLTVTGVPQYVFNQSLKNHTVILSEFILEELKEKLIDKLGAPPSKVEQVINFLRKRTNILNVPIDSKIRFEDKDDIPILSLAVISGAHYLVTGDKKLIHLKKIGKTLMLTPREALEVL